MPYADKDRQREAVRDAMRRKRGTVRRPGRPKKGEGRGGRRLPPAAANEQAAPPRTPDEAQDGLARIAADPGIEVSDRIRAYAALLDTWRRDGGDDADEISRRIAAGLKEIADAESEAEAGGAPLEAGG